jgi:tyrosyl-tRNA synthetase
MRPDADAQVSVLRHGAVQIVTEAELLAKLDARRPLIVKAGFDPTAPDLHLGHTVLLRKLRQFQDLGHRVIFLIGDATALVGDPSGQTTTRRVMTREEVERNAKTYLAQVSSILSTDRLRVVYNSDWFLERPRSGQDTKAPFAFTQFVQLASKITVARLIERDDFANRLKAGKPVSFLELFYPLMQGYDSVMIAERFGHCDVELGGTDQTFNLLLGRELLKAYGHEPQVVLTLPLLEGTDGAQKMSKTLGNHIGLTEPPGEMFGKLMSIPDTLIIKYFTLLTDLPAERLSALTRQLAERAVNPRDAKADLAMELVRSYHGEAQAQQARAEFEQVFSRREPPSEMPVVEVRAGPEGQVDLIGLLVSCGLSATRNEARRLIRQGAVTLDGHPVTQPAVPAAMAQGILQVGPRRFRRLHPPLSPDTAHGA